MKVTETTLHRLEDEFDEWLALVCAELTPEQAKRILAQKAKNSCARSLLPGPCYEILPSN